MTRQPKRDSGDPTRHADLRLEPGEVAADEVVTIARSSSGEAFFRPTWLTKSPPRAREAGEMLQRLTEQMQHLSDHLDDVVVEARDAGLSWDRIGWCMGLSGEAVRKRFSE